MKEWDQMEKKGVNQKHRRLGRSEAKPPSQEGDSMSFERGRPFNTSRKDSEKRAGLRSDGSNKNNRCAERKKKKEEDIDQIGRKFLLRRELRVSEWVFFGQRVMQSK